MTTKRLKNELTLQIVDLPVPILRYPKWVEIKYPKSLEEQELINLLKESLKEVEKFANKSKVKQIKIATNPSWSKLSKIGLTRTVYYLTNNSESLVKIEAKTFSLIKISSPKKIKNLINDQFLYHCRYKPIYFTCDIESRVQWLINLAKENIKKKEGFIVGTNFNGKIVGFLYGEFYESEGCIDELFVEEKSRGKGIGKFLLKKAGETFFKRRLEKIGLFTGIDKEFWGFYEKLGFKKEFVNWIKNLDA